MKKLLFVTLLLMCGTAGADSWPLKQNLSNDVVVGKIELERAYCINMWSYISDHPYQRMLWWEYNMSVNDDKKIRPEKSWKYDSQTNTLSDDYQLDTNYQTQTKNLILAEKRADCFNNVLERILMYRSSPEEKYAFVKSSSERIRKRKLEAEADLEDCIESGRCPWD